MAVHFDHAMVRPERLYMAILYNKVRLQLNSYGLRSIPKFLEGVCARTSRDDDRQQRWGHREVQERQLASRVHRGLRHGVDK